METAWLRCKVLPGMFSNERLVMIEGPGGDELVSFLVDEHIVQVSEAPTPERAVDGLLRVQASAGGARVKVMLPVSTAELGRVVSVPLELLAQQ